MTSFFFFLLLLLLLVFFALAHDLDRDVIRCIMASKQQSALARWMECLPPPPTDRSGSYPPENRILHRHSFDSSLDSPSSAPNFCYRHESLSGAIGLDWSEYGDIECVGTDAQGNAGGCDAIGNFNGTAIVDVHMKDNGSTVQQLDSSGDPPDEIELITGEGGAALDCPEPSKHSREASTACDEPAADSWQQPEESNALASTMMGASVGNARLASADDKIVVKVTNGSSGLLIREAEIEAGRIDCGVQTTDMFIDQSDAFSATVKLNAVVLLLVLIAKGWRKMNRKRPQSQKRCRSRGTLDAALHSGRAIRQDGDIAQVKTVAGGVQPGNLGAPLGTAVGAVFAEVFLNGRGSSRSCDSEAELCTLLETAMRESLTPVGALGLLEDFMASFRSTFNTICKVRQACSKTSGVPYQEAAGEYRRSEYGGVINQTGLCNITDAESDVMSAKWSQLVTHAGDADALYDKSKKCKKYTQGPREHCLKCAPWDSHADDANEDCLDSLKHKVEFQPRMCATRDVLEKTDVCFPNKACSQNMGVSCQEFGEIARICTRNELGRPGDTVDLCNIADAKNRCVSCRLSQLRNQAKGTDALSSNWERSNKVICSSKKKCFPCGTCGSDAGAGSENSFFYLKHRKEVKSRVSSVQDTFEKGENIDASVECAQLRERNELWEKGKAIVVEESAMQPASPASFRNSLTSEPMRLRVRDFQHADRPQVIFEHGKSEHEEKMQATLCLLGKEMEVEHYDKTSPCASPMDCSQEDDDSSATQEHSDTLQSTDGMLDAVVLAGPTHEPAQGAWQKAFLHVFENSVRAQEQHNYIKSVELTHLFRQLTLEEERLQLSSTSNELMKENIDLSRSKAILKESMVLERRVNAAHVEFSRTCADELVAGLFVMLLSMAYGVRKYSFVLLSDLISTCQPSIKEPRQSSWFHIDWFYNSVDALFGQLQAFICQVTVAGRILIGLAIVTVVASSLLRQSVTSSSQSMPATIIIIVLGGVCGFAGKLSVDSLGGNGLRWLFVWEIFCVLHAFAICFTPFVFKMVNGSPMTKVKLQIPIWLRRVAFHSTIVLILPVLAGQLPFGSLSTVTRNLYLVLADIVSPTVVCFWESMKQLI